MRTYTLKHRRFDVYNLNIQASSRSSVIGLKSRFQTTSLTFSYHIDFVCRNPLNFNFRNPGIMLCICNFVVSLDDLVNNRRVQLRRTFRRSGIHTHHLALYQFIYNLIQTVQLIHIQRPLSPTPSFKHN